MGQLEDLHLGGLHLPKIEEAGRHGRDGQDGPFGIFLPEKGNPALHHPGPKGRGRKISQGAGEPPQAHPGMTHGQDKFPDGRDRFPLFQEMQEKGDVIALVPKQRLVSPLAVEHDLQARLPGRLHDPVLHEDGRPAYGLLLGPQAVVQVTCKIRVAGSRHVPVEAGVFRHHAGIGCFVRLRGFRTGRYGGEAVIPALPVGRGGQRGDNGRIEPPGQAGSDGNVTSQVQADGADQAVLEFAG